MSDIPNNQERKTCMPCRTRKVKCDGSSPKCGPCTMAKRPLECVFPERAENRDKRNALPKGKACLSCRSKKKKCDGLRPVCSTCSRSRDSQPCTYDEGSNTSRGGSEGEFEDDSPTHTPYNLDSHTGQYNTNLRVLVPSSSDSEDVCSLSLSSPSTPPPLRPLPLLRAVDELRYFRTLAFSNALRLGICFTKLKERFILEGDLTGHVVHPWFIWFMAVMGVHLHQEIRHEWQQLGIQRHLTQVLLTMVVGMKDTGPRFDLLQAWYFMAMSCTYTHTLVPAQRYLLRCQELIKSEDMRLVEPNWIDASTRASPSDAPAHDCPPEYTEKKHELVSVLVNLMYLQCMHCLLYGECHGMFADLEAQLPDFARAYPEIYELSSMVLRTRTVLLVRDVFLHLDLLGKPGISQKEWLTDAVNLMAPLDLIYQALENAVKLLNDTGRMSPRESHETRQTYLLMSSCKLFCVTAQARIYKATSELPIVPKGQKNHFCGLARDSVQSFFLIYKTFDQEGDLRHLDYFLISCWYYIRELYPVLYPGDLEWYPFAEVSRQVILLEGSLRVTPAGKGVSVVHSMVGLEAKTPASEEPDFLKEDERLKWGL
ncbi:hypothetical protein BJ322DRAFT_20130 [Thelephora terrestris]|uniref:Zn(2)-C6 fungal-type domain-containing protein n=1 Tax=Thelephora terrestris TaxID=56493 RepID=A0A9P6LBY7_9AGAM|nr:hypothetical protein BJ322DRAFT_20130 [Thelephora terrestris]